MSIEIRKDKTFEISVPVVVIGAGACGLVAALAAKDAGCDVVVLERDAQASGSTALSSGFIPACETRFQRERGVSDSVERMVADIQAKNHHESDPDMVTAVCRTSGPAIEWLAPIATACPSYWWKDSCTRPIAPCACTRWPIERERP